MSSEYLNNKTFEAIINRFQSAKRSKARHEILLEDLRLRKERKTKRGLEGDEDAMIELCRAALVQSATDYEDSKRKLAAAFYILSENIVRYAKFELIDPDDAIQEGVMICFEKIDRFDSRKGKAFNYMTTCILNHFRQLYRTARNYNELKKKYQDFIHIALDIIL